MEYEQLVKATKTLAGFEIVFIILAAIAFIITVYLFIKYKVPNLISEITGKTRQKQIEKMEAERTSKSIANLNFEFDDNSGEYEASSNSKRQRNGTVSKDERNKKNRRQTSLAQNKRKTVAIERDTINKSKKSSHQTVAIKRSDEVESIKLEVIDELLLINSKEIIE